MKKWEYLLMIFCLLFSFWLMTSTFSYNPHTQSIEMGTKLWSDFSAHIPLIRSFSLGENLTRLFSGKPVESPLFPGEPIRYHIGFYALVGLLEKLGIRIDWAVHIPSILGFFLMLFALYRIGETLFNNKMVGILAIIFFLFNGSLGFIKFFQTHPLSWQTPIDITTNREFPVFGPWDGQAITAFWTLNVYTNQRHLAFAFGLALLGIYLLIQPRKGTPSKSRTIFLIFIASMLLFSNYAAFALFTILACWIFLVESKTRKSLIYITLATIPMAMFTQSITHIPSNIIFQPGYLIRPPLNFTNIMHFWFFNLGLHTLLIPLGMLLAPRHAQKILIVPFCIMMILPNLFRFSPDMINNHKFFNFAIVLGGLFSAQVIVQLSSYIKKIHHSFILLFFYPLILLLGFFTTLSGVIDFFAVANDRRGTLADVASNEDATFIKNNTKPTDIILNSRWLYHPGTLAGRAIFSGYPYFTWSYGYDKDAREQVINQIYDAPSTDVACVLLQENNISWVEIQTTPEEYIHINQSLWEKIQPDYTNAASGYTLYATHTICTQNESNEYQEEPSDDPIPYL